METVERALGDLRVSGGNGAHRGRRGGGPGGRGGAANQGPIKVPTTDFDFESSNAKFDKASLNPARSASAASGQNDSTAAGESGVESVDGGEAGAARKGVNGEEKKDDVKAAYNPSSSFFDSLSSSTGPASAGFGNHPGGNFGGRGRGRGRGGGRNRREEEREKNVATFGEPGGVGLMGPGAYVGGWGRRGGRRGGRGGGGGYHGGHVQGQGQVQAAVARG